MGRPRVAIIILNWNGQSDTIECLHSVTDMSYPNCKTIVVDNGSTDGSIEAVQETFPSVDLIANSDNLGFAAGNNIGIRQALNEDVDYVFLLNNDTVVDPNILEALVAAAETEPQIGIVGPKIYYYDEPERLWYAGAREQWLRHIPATIGLDELDQGQYDQRGETAFVYGTAMLVRREVVEKIGMLDERFFAYHEDADFCIRARQTGYRCFYEPGAVMWHKVSAATQTAPHIQDYLRGRARILFFVKHLEGLHLVIVLFYELYRLTKVGIQRLYDGQPERAKNYLDGVCDGIREFILGEEPLV